MGVIRLALAFAAATVSAVLLASAFHTQMVIAGLGAAGAAIDAATRLAMMAADLKGLAPSYGAVIAIALAIGFFVAAWLKRVVRPLAPIAYPLAGAAAIGVALALMSIVYEGVTPIASARSPEGFALQCLAGALGGVVFAWLSKSRAG